jgi:hypothetical protein
MVRGSSTRTKPGSPPLYEQVGLPSASAVARKNMSRASMNSRSRSLMVSLTSSSSMRSAMALVSNRSCSVRLSRWYP